MMIDDANGLCGLNFGCVFDLLVVWRLIPLALDVSRELSRCMKLDTCPRICLIEYHDSDAEIWRICFVWVLIGYAALDFSNSTYGGRNHQSLFHRGVITCKTQQINDESTWIDLTQIGLFGVSSISKSSSIITNVLQSSLDSIVGFLHPLSLIPFDCSVSRELSRCLHCEHCVCTLFDEYCVWKAENCLAYFCWYLIRNAPTVWQFDDIVSRHRRLYFALLCHSHTVTSCKSSPPCEYRVTPGTSTLCTLFGHVATSNTTIIIISGALQTYLCLATFFMFHAKSSPVSFSASNHDFGHPDCDVIYSHLT
jgi:hypothetical protein